MGASVAFTLVELLVVIAITVILFALLLRPLLESLRLTQSAQVQAAAQDAARITLERITRELGSAVFVYDNASHPFVNYTLPTGAAAAGTNYDKYTDFLDLEVTKSDGSPAIEHAYNSKLDIVSARHSGDQTKTDPTTGEPIQLKGGTGSATLSSTGLLFPLAPGSTLTRYFVGLKRPVDYTTTPGSPAQGLYSNSNEGLLAAASSQEDNTYILYSAQVQPYNPASAAKNADGTTINENLFAPMKDGTGAVVNKPELDDPDFFRYVSTTDVDWLTPTHADFSAADAADHNTRVENWVKVAKAIITAPDIDLLALPHNPDNSIAYDTSGTFNNVAHSGTVTDPVTSIVYPVVNTTISFRPALVEGDVAPGTTTDYSSAGVPANAADNGGLPYIPTVYTASSKSWGFPPHIDLYPQGATTTSGVSYYTTDTITTVPTGLPAGATVNAGDLVELYHANGATTGTPVYDITQGIALAATHYVPMSVNLDTGTIDFDTPAFPEPPIVGSTTYNPYLRFWTADPTGLNNGTLLTCIDSSGNNNKGQIDLKNLAADNNGVLSSSGGTNNSPLSVLGQTTGAGSLAAANAFVVPGSVRVYGPDATPGPNIGSRVLYSAVSPGTPLSFNEYRVDYLNGIIQLDADDSNQLPVSKADGTAADPVQVAFDYQANLAPTDATTAISPTNPASPMAVKVDYETRDLLQINIGVRIYDAGQGRSITIPVSNQVQIGNSNR